MRKKYQTVEEKRIAGCTNMKKYYSEAPEKFKQHRVDNSRGYVEDNVVTCCKICNVAKAKQPRADFEAWAIRVARQATNLEASIGYV